MADLNELGAKQQTGSPLPPQYIHGDAIGPYRILETLGTGGMGVVYRALHDKTGEQVAIKTICIADEAVVESIHREIHALARIRHPGIVEVLAHGTEKGKPWYAMQLLEGVLLRGLLDVRELDNARGFRRTTATIYSPTEPGGRIATSSDSGDVKPDKDVDRTSDRRSCASVFDGVETTLTDVLTLVRELCSALSFLHGEGIVHGDLKPENILLNEQQHPVIIDFGLATQFEGRLSLTLQNASGHVSGTLPYISPEMLQGSLIDARADLYAVGCILYEILAGRPPFTGDRKAIVRGHLSSPPPPLSNFVTDLPEELYRLVDGLLAKDPAERIGYASDVSTLLASMGAQNRYDVRGCRAYVYRPRFRGREEAFSAILQRMHSADTGHGSVVLIGGESGVGKTRLLFEVVRAASEHGLTVLMGECLPDGSRPLEAFRQPLRHVASRCRRLGLDETERLLGSRGKLLALYEPELAELPGQDHYPDAQLEQMPVKERTVRLFRSIYEVLAALAKDRAVVIVLDDIHWADELTMGFLNFLQDETDVEKKKLLFICAYRIEAASSHVARLSRKTSIYQLQLGRLSEAAVAEMAVDMLATGSAAAMGRYLWLHSEGNPFFVAEYLRAVVHEGILTRDPSGSWIIPDRDMAGTDEAADASLPLPQSLRDLIEWRFRNLPEYALFLLSAAAVLGREFEVGAIRAMVAHLNENEQFHSLNELIRTQTLEEIRAGTLRFNHDKLREVAYSWISPEQRRELHRDAATAIERLLSEISDPTDAERRKEEKAAALSLHYREAALYREALRYARIAGKHAVKTLADEDAISHFESALEMLNHVPESPSALADSVDLRLELSIPRMHLHSAADDETLRLCRDAEPIAERLGNTKQLLELYRALSSCLFSRAEYDECIRYGKRCIELAKSIGDEQSVCTAAYTLAIHLLETGQIRSVEELAPPTIYWLEHAGSTQLLGQPYPPYVTLSGSVGVACGMMGKLDESEQWHNKSINVAMEANHKYGLALAHVLWGWSCYSRGDGRGCRIHGDEVLRIAGPAKLQGPRMMGLYNAGLGYVLEGSVSQGIALLEEGLDMAAGLRYRALRTEAYYGLAQGYLAQGELGRAAAVCDEALWFSNATGEGKLTPEFHRLMADISLRRGTRHLADARRHLQAAIKICAETGMSLFACRSQLLLAKVYRKEKDFSGARMAATRARELLPARAPEGWLRDAEEELSLVNGPLRS